MNEKVSIITVVYNNVQTIEQTIQSVLNQTYPNIEYIILDGGSTDGTVEVIRRYLDRIAIFISEKDEGLYDAMNKGIGLASGEIVGILNSDDTYDASAVSCVVENFRNQRVDVLYGNVLMMDGTIATKMYDCSDIEELWYRMAIPHPATFVKKEIYVKYGTFDTQYQIAADYDLMLRFYSKGVRFWHIDNVLTYFRLGGVSFSKVGVCTEEGRAISNKYIKYCDKKEYYSRKIQEEYIRRKFVQLYRENDQLIIDEFKRIIEISAQNRFVIFGTGKWGERCFQLLSKSGAFVEFFTDNHSAKWGQTFHGITIIPPSQLCNNHGHLLIGTFRYEQDICLRLKELDRSLDIILLSELAERLV